MDYFIQTNPNEFRPCGEHEITIRQLISFVHCYTEILKIYIVRDYSSCKDLPKGCKNIPRLLSDNVYQTGYYTHGDPKCKEVERLLKYYGDCPCWNLAAEIVPVNYKFNTPIIVAHVQFRDLKAAYIQERKDIMKERRKTRKEE